MTSDLLTNLIFAAGIGHLGVFAVAMLVPFQLNWRTELQSLARLHRQMHWVYAGYVGLSILAFAALSVMNARELASGSPLARGVCAYIAVFWGVRLILQGVFDIKTHTQAWWLRAGYLTLGVMFGSFTAVYAMAAIHLYD